MGLSPMERRELRKAFPHAREWCDMESMGGRVLWGIKQLLDCSVCDLDLKLTQKVYIACKNDYLL